tara:strand:- start:4971 stop:5147 length:177 start_codon:yes stop_codon:yes gene_type:complete
MNESKIRIIEQELKDAQWEVDYHNLKLNKARVLVELFYQKLEEAKGEQKLLDDYTDEC